MRLTLGSEPSVPGRLPKLTWVPWPCGPDGGRPPLTVGGGMGDGDRGWPGAPVGAPRFWPRGMWGTLLGVAGEPLGFMEPKAISWRAGAEAPPLAMKAELRWALMVTGAGFAGDPLGTGPELTMTGPPEDGGAVAGFPLAGRSAVSLPWWTEPPPTMAGGVLDAMAGAPCGLPFVAEAYDEGRARGGGALVTTDGAPEDCSAGLLGDDVFPVEVIRETVSQTDAMSGEEEKGVAADDEPQLAQIKRPDRNPVRKRTARRLEGDG
jgi:hypothetical protein